MRDTPLKVLLVEDNPGDARLLQVGLTEEAGDAFEVKWVQTLEDAVRHVATDFIDAVVLDLNLPDSSGFETFARMHAAADDVPVLVLTGLEDDTIGLKTIQQGAQDYLSKADLSGTAVARALRYAIERHHSRLRELRQVKAQRRGQLIGFMGAKGGVGTTTLVLNMAALLAKNTRRMVTAVELRGDFGSFAAHLNEEPPHTLGDLLKLDAATTTDSVIDKCVSRSRLGFDVLFSPQRPESFCALDVERVRTLTDQLAHRSTYTLIDLPSRCDPVAEAVLRSCDLTILVLERDPSSVAAGAVALEFLRQGDKRRPNVVLAVVNRSLMMDGNSPKQVETTLRCDLLGVVPPAPDVSASAQKFGTPIALHRPLSAPASMLNSISERIIGRLETPSLLEHPMPVPA